jgi:plasmid stabilization system protein ParE
MPSRVFEYHPEAVKEAWEAFHWYDERSEQAAKDFWQEIRRARLAITDQPQSGSPYFHGTRCRRLTRFSYGLVYVERTELLIGIAVAHLKRRPGYWRERLGD